jgi:hypothetical protein
MVNLQLTFEGLVVDQFLFELLGVERISFVDAVGQLCLGLVVELFDLVDLICVEDVLVANFLQESSQGKETSLRI